MSDTPTQDTRCPVCGIQETEIIFSDGALMLHCLGCLSDTAGGPLLSVNKQLSAAQAEIERLREDAERYRYFRQWWCDDSKPNSPILDAMTPEETDAAIDKERRA